jgi:3-methyl-2-oxobutanoate hydroxymethyltransferase
VSGRLSIPTIGIGAGAGCDGQVLVCYDLLGMNPGFKPKFVKRYAELHENIQEAAKTFFAEVRSRAFPDEAHAFGPAPAAAGLRLVANDSPAAPEREEPVGPVYGVPV